jgi:23S rRNA (guanosine2251-2'-O)-methyltransferase
VQFVDPRHLDAVSATGAHQGVVALVSAYRTLELEGLLEQARARGQPFLILLDGIEDPRNLGAILRTAEAAGAHGAVIPRRRAAGLSPAVAKASAGAVEHLPVALVTNMARTVEVCRDAGLLTVAAAPDAPQCYDEVALRPPLALVIGGEESGVRRLVRERCDLGVRIPMKGRVASLNASVAAAILLFEVVRQMRHSGG